jgi:hypothetical protein
MKRLYARLVLWLIRPALNAARLTPSRQGGIEWRFRRR